MPCAVQDPPEPDNIQNSWFLSETLKYLFLIFRCRCAGWAGGVLDWLGWCGTPGGPRLDSVWCCWTEGGVLLDGAGAAGLGVGAGGDMPGWGVT